MFEKVGDDGVVSLTDRFGSENSNSHFDQTTQDRPWLSVARCLASREVQLLGMYTDDFFAIALSEVVDAETASFCSDAEERYGVTATKTKKTLRGTHVDIIGLANDMIKHTIGMSSTTFLKMLCLFYVMLPMDIAAGDWVDVRLLECLAQRAIRCTNVVKVMVAFSPMEFARAQCARAGLPFHVSCCTIAAKPDAAIGWLITDYSHPVGAHQLCYLWSHQRTPRRPTSVRYTPTQCMRSLVLS